MAMAETSSCLQPNVYFTLANPAMPISPTYMAAGYTLCKPFSFLNLHASLPCCGIRKILFVRNE
jgi:hypothetical protein